MNNSVKTIRHQRTAACVQQSLGDHEVSTVYESQNDVTEKLS